jgi:hypothetical protein
LIADGPRPAQAGEAELCAAARACAAQIEWDCQVETNFAETNLGLNRRVESGLDWVFERAEQAIILEDDCLPGPRFFSFCDELLQRYQADECLLTVSGNNFQFGRRRGQASYYFSRYPHIWGWATWRRAWRLHDPDMATWPAARDAGWLADWLQDDAAVKYWSYLFQKNFDTHHTWDYAWTWACWLHRGLHILPSVNLVSNIGFGSGATHTTNERDVLANLPLEDLPFPLQHPTEVERNVEADAFTESLMFSGNLTRLLATARARVRGGRG